MNLLILFFKKIIQKSRRKSKEIASRNCGTFSNYRKFVISGANIKSPDYIKAFTYTNLTHTNPRYICVFILTVKINIYVCIYCSPLYSALLIVWCVLWKLMLVTLACRVSTLPGMTTKVKCNIKKCEMSWTHIGNPIPGMVDLAPNYGAKNAELYLQDLQD